jgi:hypothetical protein
VVALGFIDFGFVGLPIWLILSLVVGFMQWVLVGYEVGQGGFLWGVWLAVGRGGLRGVSWWICGVACGGSRSALGGSEMSVCGCGSVFGRNEICVSYL